MVDSIAMFCDINAVKKKFLQNNAFTFCNKNTACELVNLKKNL